MLDGSVEQVLICSIGHQVSFYMTGEGVVKEEDMHSLGIVAYEPFHLTDRDKTH